MRDLHRICRKWTQTARFSAVVILAATVAVIVPAAVDVTQQGATPTAAAQR